MRLIIERASSKTKLSLQNFSNNSALVLYTTLTSKRIVILSSLHVALIE